MRLNFYLIGKIKTQQYQELIEYYLGLSQKKHRQLALKLTIIPDKNSKAAIDPQAVLADYRLSSLQSFFLAEWGKLLTTTSLYARLQHSYELSEQVNFIVGNAWGWTKNDTSASELQFLSLSPLVFNHELACLMLAEQIYRFADKLAGGNYAK